MKSTRYFSVLVSAIVFMAAINRAFAEEPPVKWMLSEFQLKMTRSECLGECPCYTISVRGNGEGVYEGYSHVAVEGRHVFYVSRENIILILQKLFETSFFDTRYNFVVQVDDQDTVTLGETITVVHDAPFVRIEVKIGSFEKGRHIKHLDSEKEFWNLAREIDTILQTNDG